MKIYNIQTILGESKYEKLVKAVQNPYVLWYIIFALLFVIVFISGIVLNKPVQASSESMVAPIPEEKVIVEMEPAKPPVEVVEVPEVIEKPDGDIKVIKDYLVSYGSPHPELAETIVVESKKYGLDPYMVTAIMCQESSCAKSCNSNNCLSYGITDSVRVGETVFDKKSEGLEVSIKRMGTDFSGAYAKCGRSVSCFQEVGYNTYPEWAVAVNWFLAQLGK